MQRTLTRALPALAAVLVLAGPAGAQATRPANEPRTRPKLHFRIEEGKRIVLETKVCLRGGDLELLVCTKGSKEHESILHTEARPALLHAALVGMGLRPGKPARWSSDGEDGRFLPPRGPNLRVRLRWRDKKDKLHTADASEWLKIAGEKEAKIPEHWVFVGSEILPDSTYWADAEGDLISVSNFASSVIDVPFESSADNAARFYRAKTGEIPPLKTPVEVIIEPMKGARNSPHARALLEIGPQGQLAVDSEPTALGKLADWADDYIHKHAKGMVVVRADGRARITDLVRVRQELRMGGVTEIDEQHLQARPKLLPRTETQAKAALAEWRKKFAEPREYIEDPHEEAARTLKLIDYRTAQLQRLQALWKDYEAYLESKVSQKPETPEPAER